MFLFVNHLTFYKLKPATDTDIDETPACLNTHLSESSDSVLIGEEWRVIANLEVKVNCLVCEGREFIAEAELVGAILSSCKGKAVILLLHFFIQCSAIWVLQTTVYIIMATSHNLEKYKTRKDIYSVR